MKTLFRLLTLASLSVLTFQTATHAATTNLVRVASSPAFVFSPTNITIETGDSIRWTNVSANPPDVTPGIRVGSVTNNPVTPQWAPVNLPANNGTALVTFSNIGVYPYLCGQHVFSITPRLGQTGTVFVVQANLRPTVALVSPANLATFTAPANVQLSATAADADGTVTNVQFFSGTNQIGSVVAAPYDMSVTLAAGWHQITARATDDLGGTTTTPIVNVLVNSNQVISVVGTSFSPKVVTLTVGDTLTINGLNGFHTATGSGAVEPFCGSTFPASCTVTFNTVGNFPFHCNPHRTFGMTGLVQVVGPDLLPTVTLTAPANGAVLAAPATFNLVANAQDLYGSIRNVRFLRSPSSSLGLITAAPFQFTNSNVGPGTYSFFAITTDNTSRLGTSAPVTVTVVTPVDIQLRSPVATANGFQFDYTANPGLNYVIEGSAADGAPVPFIPLATNRADAATMQFIDTSSGARADRVYRVYRQQ